MSVVGACLFHRVPFSFLTLTCWHPSLRWRHPPYSFTKLCDNLLLQSIVFFVRSNSFKYFDNQSLYAHFIVLLTLMHLIWRKNLWNWISWLFKHVDTFFKSLIFVYGLHTIWSRCYSGLLLVYDLCNSYTDNRQSWTDYKSRTNYLICARLLRTLYWS